MKVTEYCPHCEHEVKIQDLMFGPQPCPKCGHAIKACSLCDTDICDCAKCERKFPCKIYEVAVFSKRDPEDDFGQWETLLSTDSAEEAEDAFHSAIHDGILGPCDTGYTDRIAIYQRQPDGSQECVNEQYA